MSSIVHGRIATFSKVLLARLAPQSAILEIGSGDGQLAKILSEAGHDVTAIDRTPRSTFPIEAVSFEEFDAHGKRFDCIVAMLVLHHIHDLDRTVARIASLLAPGGTLAVDDYGWERLDESDEQSRAWRHDRAELHTSEVMISVLDRHLRRTFYFDHAYFDEGKGHDLLGFTYLGTPLQLVR